MASEEMFSPFVIVDRNQLNNEHLEKVLKNKLMDKIPILPKN